MPSEGAKIKVSNATKIRGGNLPSVLRSGSVLSKQQKMKLARRIMGNGVVVSERTALNVANKAIKASTGSGLSRRTALLRARMRNL